MQVLRSALTSSLRSPIRQSKLSLVGKALAILRKYGSNAHVYMPGAGGVAVSGLLSNNYTLSDGSTGYSAVDGAAGLVLDAAGSVGAELFTGAFTRNNTVESDTTTVPAVCTSTGVFSVVGINKSATANTPYLCSLTWSGNTTGRTIQVGGGSAVAVLGTAVSGSATFTVVPSIGNMYIYFAATSAGQSVSFDSFSAKPYSGIHLTQSTTANKPAVRRGLYNLLTYSNDLSNAVWTPEFTASKSGSNILTPAVGDDVYHGTTVPAGSYTLAAQLSGSGTCTLFAYNATNGLHGMTQITLTSTPTIFAANITSTAANPFYYIGRRTGDTATSITFGGAGLFQGTLTAAQILAEGGIPLTTSAAASNSGAGRYWWGFDGTNDSLALGSVPFQMSDDHCVISGFRADAGNGFVVGIANAGGTTTCGSLRLATNGTLSAWWMDDVGAQSLIYGPSSVIGTTLVASARKVGNVKSLRSNGTQVSTDSTPLGTTTLTNSNIGSFTAVSGFMRGSIGPVVFIKGTVSDADLLTLERWVASLTPTGPTF